MLKERTKNSFTFVKEFFVSSVFPLHCVGCDAEGMGLCARCLAYGADSEMVSRPGVAQILALGPHADPIVQRAIHALKFGYIESIGDVLGRALGCVFIERFPGVSPVLVPIPLHKKRELMRDFNQAQLIAQGIARVVPGAMVVDVLSRTKETQAQATLGRSARQKNVENVFSVVRPPGRSVWLVDDVVTTGATVQSATQALIRVGVEQVSGLVVAHEA